MRAMQDHFCAAATSLTDAPRSTTKGSSSGPGSSSNLWIKIGDEAYHISVDGKLMPSKKDQPPPDLSYFKKTQN